MFGGDWSEDLPRTYDDDESAGSVNRPPLELPSERHVALYRLLRSTARQDHAGRLVSWWPQAKLAARLEVSVRTLQRLLADLREPGPDPRHPNRAPGLRLGLVRVEPTHYRDQASRRHRLGGNLYVLTSGQHATVAEPSAAGQVNTTAEQVSCLNKEPPATEERRVSNPLVSREVPAVLEVGDQHPYEPSWGELELTKDQILERLAGQLGEVEVLEVRPNDQPPPTYTTARGRRLDLEAGSLADFHAAVDQLDRDTCSHHAGPCQAGHRCPRHTRRANRARG